MKIELSVEELKQLTQKIKISAAGTTDILTERELHQISEYFGKQY